MRILYLAEYNLGGGAKSNINLAEATSKFAEVAFFGIQFDATSESKVKIINNKAIRPLSFRYLIGLWRSLREFNPEIVHATGMYTGVIALVYRYLRRRSFIIILTLHHTSTQFRFHLISKMLVPLLNKVNAIHYLTNYQRIVFQNIGLSPTYFKIIPNIIYPRYFSNTLIKGKRNELLGLTHSRYLIVYVGRVIEEKQVHLLVDVVRLINQEGFDVGGIIVGDGDEDYIKKIKAKIRKSHLKSKVYFTGFKTDPDLYIKVSDFCIFPTQHAEALPLFMLESFSQQKAMVVSNHPSIQMIARNRYNTLIAEKHTSESYANRCLELISKPLLRQKLEVGAKETFNEHYHADKVISQFKEFYNEIIELQ